MNTPLPMSVCLSLLTSTLTSLFLSSYAIGSEPTTASNTAPNVLFVVIDDLNDWVSHLGGHPQSVTPNIDSLASRGVYFSNAHCVAPACNPSRSAIMSGLRPYTSGVYYNGAYWQKALEGVNLLNQHFIANGYDAVAGGKIYHGSSEDAKWKEYYKWGGGVKTSRNKNGLNWGHFDWGPIDCDDDGMAGHHLVDWAIDQMNAEREKPVFLAVGFVKPHAPFYAPKKYFDQHPIDQVQLPLHIENDLDDLPKKGVKAAIRQGEHARVTEAGLWKEAVQGYLSTVAFVDHQVGRLIKGLDESPMADNTIVVLWSDHGWNLGEKQHWRKFALWNDTTRVPFIVIAPGVTAPGGKAAAPVDLQSIYPTLCDLAGIPTPDHVEGVSLRPLLENPNVAWDRPAICTNGKGNYMIQTKHQRLIRYSDGSKELYDHRQDPHEWHNLAGDDKYSEVIHQMLTWIPKTEAEVCEKDVKRVKKREAKDKRLRKNAIAKEKQPSVQTVQ